jgi:hypothetical protein
MSIFDANSSRVFSEFAAADDYTHEPSSDAGFPELFTR